MKFDQRGHLFRNAEIRAVAPAASPRVHAANFHNMQISVRAADTLGMDFSSRIAWRAFTRLDELASTSKAQSGTVNLRLGELRGKLALPLAPNKKHLLQRRDYVENIPL